MFACVYEMDLLECVECVMYVLVCVRVFASLCIGACLYVHVCSVYICLCACVCMFVMFVHARVYVGSVYACV